MGFEHTGGFGVHSGVHAKLTAYICASVFVYSMTHISQMSNMNSPLGVCVCVCVWSVFRERGGEKVSTLHSSTGPVGRPVQEPSSTIPHAVGMLTD